MDDLACGRCDAQGNCAPHRPAQPAPIWQRPFSLRKLLAWLPEELWPWNALHRGTTGGATGGPQWGPQGDGAAMGAGADPQAGTLASRSPGNYLYLYAQNAGGLLLIPSNPVCASFTLHSLGFGAVNGHLGF